MNYKLKFACLAALVALLQGCGSGGVESATLAQIIVDDPNCVSSRDKLWRELYRQVDQNGRLPDTEEVGREVRTLARTAEQGDALVRVYRDLRKAVSDLGREEAIQALAEMELGDRTTPEKAARQDALEAAQADAMAISTAVDGACAPDPDGSQPVILPPADSISMFEGWRRSLPAPVYGAYKTFSVAYQSCNAVGIRPLTSSVASVDGIDIVGRHSNGVGQKRVVGDASAVFRSNPFYAGRASPVSGCFRATDTPLIYDYGGKPYANTSANSIDLFKNAGSGTSALGIDCSGFVAASVLTGGLRLKSGVSSKAAQSSGVNAAMFANPSGNGLSCLARVQSTASQRLRPGDIIANGGHVIMVDRVGADPFGIANARSAADCAAVSSSRFDFTIIQSSPSKGGIGLNRHRAADYLAGSSSMRSGLIAYAKSFCEVKLGLRSPTTLANTSKAVIVRHLGTSSCVDKPIAIEQQGCLSGCNQIAPTGLTDILADL